MKDAPVLYRRVLLKLSGEALMGDLDYGIDPAVIKRIAAEVAEIRALGIEVAIVIGGGNIFRGAGLAGAGMDRVTGDYMGMLATVMNALAIQDALESDGVFCKGDVGTADSRSLRGLHQAARRSPPREGANCHTRRWYG